MHTHTKKKRSNRGKGVAEREERVLDGRRVERTVGLRNRALSRVVVACIALHHVSSCRIHVCGNVCISCVWECVYLMCVGMCVGMCVSGHASTDR